MLRSPKPLGRAYPTELRTIGDHVRKRRLDLGLLQRQVASLLGVDTTTVINWEFKRTTPNLRALPKVVEFLGYDPTETGSTLGERLRATRRARGLSTHDLARTLRVDPSTIEKWENGQHKPWVQYLPRIFAFIGGRRP